MADAERALEIQSDWDVTRMLSMARFPPVASEMQAWLSEHEAQWHAGTAYRFAIEHRSRVVGLIDFDEVGGNEATLGYWLERAAWGQGIAFEAASAMLRFGAGDLGLRRLKAGHAADNIASGRVLHKLGFRFVDTEWRMSRPRNDVIEQCRYAREL